MSPRARRRLSAVDLFAGAGGATLGLKNARFSVKGAVEYDKVFANSYRANHPEVPVFAQDIREVDPMELLQRAGLRPGSLALLNACPPCQGFSSLGQHDADDERNDLVAQVWRFARALRPRAVVVENVPGLRRDARLEHLVRQLRGAGYGVATYLVDATALGVPQRRRRLILIAVRGKSKALLPRDLVRAAPPAFRRPPKDAAAILATLPRPEASRDRLHRRRSMKEKVRKRVARIPPGGDRFDLPESLKLECHADLGRSATASYGRIKLRGPAPTMTTRCTTPACGAFLHPRQWRSITLREAALLQTFPRGYQFRGFHGEVERQIGNAVPVRVAWAIGAIVRKLLRDAGGR